MLILDLTSGRFSGPNADQQDSQSDVCLEPNWKPVLTELQSVQPTQAEAWKPSPVVIGAGLAWLNRN